MESDPTDQNSKKYTGSESLSSIMGPYEASGWYDGALSPFYNQTTSASNKTLLVSSFDKIKTFVFAYSDHNGYMDSSYFSPVSASNNRLAIELNNSEMPVNYCGVSPYQNGTVATIAAAATARGKASDNQLIIRNSAFNILALQQGDRPGMVATAASIYKQTDDANGNIAYLENVSIKMDPSRSEADRNYVRIGALTVYDASVTNKQNNNTTWIKNSKLEVDSVFSTSNYYWNTNLSANNNVVYIENSDLWLNPESTGNNTARIA